MNDLITERPPQHQYRKPLDLLIPKSNQITLGYKSFRTLAPTIWNTLSAEIQALTKLDDFITKIGDMNFAWCSCQKCCDKKRKPNISNNKVSKVLFIGAWKGGESFNCTQKSYILQIIHLEFRFL